jgi:hypothetical protein
MSAPTRWTSAQDAVVVAAVRTIRRINGLSGKLTQGRAVFVDRRGGKCLEPQPPGAFAALVDKSRLGLNR